jgi:hypothetical protein
MCSAERLIIICRQSVEMHEWVPLGFFSMMAAGKFAYKLMLKPFQIIVADNPRVFTIEVYNF